MYCLPVDVLGYSVVVFVTPQVYVCVKKKIAVAMEDSNAKTMKVKKKKGKGHGDYCSAFGCSNSRGGNPSLSFFKFPSDSER